VPRIKYDVRGVDSGGGERHPAGVFKMKIKAITVEKPEGMDRRMKIEFSGTGKHAKTMPIFEYINLESEATRWKLRQFLEAVGHIKTKAKESGSYDPDDFVGMTINVRVREDTYNGEYSPKIGAMLKPTGDAADADDEPDDEPDEDDEPDDEEEDSGDDDEDEDYSEWTDVELRDELKERDLDVPLTGRGSKKKLDRDRMIQILEANDSEDDDSDDNDEDYSEWDVSDLKDELKERGLKTTGSKKVLVARLEEDDAADDDDEL
jgi:hypothetical protein